MRVHFVIVVLSAGCTVQSPVERDDSATTTTPNTAPSGYDGPTKIDSIRAPGCNKAGEAWVYQATTLGWTDGQNIVNVWETGKVGGWNEEHTLPSDTFGPLNSFDVVRRTLDPGAESVNFTENFNTIFECGVHDTEPVMTYAIRIYDMQRRYQDCAIFSTHGQDGIDMVLGGLAPSTNAVSKATEINSVRCTVWEL